MSQDLTLVRFWKEYGSDAANVFVEWNEGRFHLPSNHPVAREATRLASRSEYRLIVHSTDELEWVVDSLHLTTEKLKFVCVPRLKRLRSRLISDAYLIETWLAAESKWNREAQLEAQVESLAREAYEAWNPDGPFEWASCEVACADMYRAQARVLIKSGWRKDA